MGEWMELDEDDNHVLISAGSANLIRTQPLNKDGSVDETDEEVYFGLVPLGGGQYVMASVESEEGSPPISSFLGVFLQDDQLEFVFFGPGDDEESESALDEVLARHGLEREAEGQYVVQLVGDVTGEKIIGLYEDLMAAPEGYGAERTVFVRPE